MTQTCEYCGAENVEDRVIKRLSSGYGRANKSIKRFCSRECRAWWRRRCSDDPGPWEQPGPVSYQGRLSRFVTDDASESESAPQPTGIDASEPATVEAQA